MQFLKTYPRLFTGAGAFVRASLLEEMVKESTFGAPSLFSQHPTRLFLFFSYETCVTTVGLTHFLQVGGLLRETQFPPTPLVIRTTQTISTFCGVWDSLKVGRAWKGDSRKLLKRKSLQVFHLFFVLANSGIEPKESRRFPQAAFPAFLLLKKKLDGLKCCLLRNEWSKSKATTFRSWSPAAGCSPAKRSASAGGSYVPRVLSLWYWSVIFWLRS